MDTGVGNEHDILQRAARVSNPVVQNVRPPAQPPHVNGYPSPG